MGSKKLCNWSKKKIARDTEELKTIVVSPTHLCRKCARVARSTKFLCKPEKIDA